MVVILTLLTVFIYYSPASMHSYGCYKWPVFPLELALFFVAIFMIFAVLRLAFWGGGWRLGYHGFGWMYSDPKQILSLRYARGEITKEQFDQMVRDLEPQS